MEEVSRSSHLEKALQRGGDYYRRVKIGGKNYYVVVLEGREVSHIRQDVDTAKLKTLAESFFSAHNRNDPDMGEKEITHIDSKGIHYAASGSQRHDAVGLSEAEGEPLLSRFRAEQPQIVKDLNGLTERMYTKADIPARYHPLLPESVDGQYTKPMVEKAMMSYGYETLRPIYDLVTSINPACKRALDARLNEIVRSGDLSPTEKLDAACTALKQHMTAQTAWQAMMNVLFPQELILIPDHRAEEEEEVDPHSEMHSVSSSPVGSPSGSFQLDPEVFEEGGIPIPTATPPRSPFISSSNSTVSLYSPLSFGRNEDELSFVDDEEFLSRSTGHGSPPSSLSSSPRSWSPGMDPSYQLGNLEDSDFLPPPRTGHTPPTGGVERKKVRDEDDSLQFHLEFEEEDTSSSSESSFFSCEEEENLRSSRTVLGEEAHIKHGVTRSLKRGKRTVVPTTIPPHRPPAKKMSTEALFGYLEAQTRIVPVKTLSSAERKAAACNALEFIATNIEVRGEVPVESVPLTDDARILIHELLAKQGNTNRSTRLFLLKQSLRSIAIL
ncbi:MAG: hypothetical protein KDK64_05635 [Chlamydiia bacterium]|nr:hypothetical protein [Chlamydiia bacterium]